MGHRYDDGIAGKASNDVRDPGPPHLTNLIPFRRAIPAARPAADDGPPPSSATSPFDSLGSLTHAVLLKLENKRIRLRVLRVNDGEEDTIHPR
jgi:hypothetical protein